MKAGDWIRQERHKTLATFVAKVLNKKKEAVLSEIVKEWPHQAKSALRDAVLALANEGKLYWRRDDEGDLHFSLS